MLLLGTVPVATAQTPPPAPEPEALDQRGAEERIAKESRFAITPFKPNYILPVSYYTSTQEATTELDSLEVKFQLSFRIEIVPDLLGSGGALHFGYTQQSFWQAYNSDISSPFRETNYEPEFTWSRWWPRTGEGWNYRGLMFGLSHQSNGQTGPLSRSWNRLYANFIFDYGDLYFSVRPWYRFPEDPKDDPTSAQGDDNPDILDYMGHGEFLVMWTHREHRVGLLLRNNFSSPNYGAVQLDWSFPIGGKVSGYAQYFYGYGESLIDYNDRVKRLGIGLMLNNWL
jgi:phospholipase A1